MVRVFNNCSVALKKSSKFSYFFRSSISHKIGAKISSTGVDKPEISIFSGEMNPSLSVSKISKIYLIEVINFSSKIFSEISFGLLLRRYDHIIMSYSIKFYFFYFNSTFSL